MKRALIVVACGMAVFGVAAQVSMKEKKERGTYNAVAKMKVVLRCVDQDGQAVPDVTVSTGVSLDGNPETTTQINGKTDKDGCLVVAGKGNGAFGYLCGKKGYYDTWEVKKLSNFPEVYVSHGRWQPYGMTNTVVLKRKVNPVAMYAFDYTADYTVIPEIGEPLGFDLMAGDWVAPNGTGKTPDFKVTYFRDGEGRDFTHQELVLTADGPFAGFMKVKSDTYSAFKSPHHADTNDVYTQELRFTFDRPSDTGRYVDGRMTAEECIVFRSRTRIDKDGRLVGAHYGKIYGPLKFATSHRGPGSMKPLFYLNPTENDTNLEYDPRRNLLYPKARNSPP
jgi:hypothetical protein